MRTADEIKHHYTVEKELADRLRKAQRSDRAQLYGRVYDELFRRVPNHPQLTRKKDPDEQDSAVKERMALLSLFLKPETVFLEIGAGDGSLARAAAKRIKKSYALDVSKEILNGVTEKNMEMVLSDGCSVPVASGTVTLAYSYQVMEHIHPDDAVEQLKNIFTALAPGGVYLCVTPSKVNGPHDVSQFFSPIAEGLHLKEYTYTELNRLFLWVGFRRTKPYVGLSHHYFHVPLFLLTSVEKILGWFPFKFRHWLGNLRGVQNFLFISLAAVK